MLRMQTILLATDFSGHSNLAFRLACTIARDYAARLVVVHVAVPPVGIYGQGRMAPRLHLEELERLRDKLEELQPRDPRVQVEHRLVEGEATEQILRTAAAVNADLIMVGTHGRTGLGRLLMGSVAEEVLRKAPCPVLTVKLPMTTNQPPRRALPDTAATAAQ
jgi:nucleotide-binding universal stress UspA family protein